MIEFKCTHCAQSILLSDDKAGRSGHCPHCKKPLTVPAESDLQLHDDAFAHTAEVAGASTVASVPPVIQIGTKALSFVGNSFAWFFGLVFVLLFLFCVWKHPAVSLLALTGAALLLPPVHARLQALLPAPINVKSRVIVSVVCFFAYTVMLGLSASDDYNEEGKAKEIAAQKQREGERGEAIAYLSQNKTALHNEANSLLAQGKTSEALASARRYQGLGDPEMDGIILKAQAAEKDKASAAKKSELLATLVAIKDDNLPERARVYEQLSRLEPGNVEYKKKAGEIGAIVAQAEAKQRATQEAEQARALRQASGLTWRYDTYDDDMSQKKISTATLSSTNTLSFSFPYAGEQHAMLQLRKHPRWGSNVILKIERGQFLCNSYDGCSVMVRFGAGKPQQIGRAHV